MVVIKLEINYNSAEARNELSSLKKWLSLHSRYFFLGNFSWLLAIGYSFHSLAHGMTFGLHQEETHNTRYEGQCSQNSIGQ